MNDDLSRLLDGELSPAEAEGLHARIHRDPALAREWAAMQALPGALASLPREMTPPPLRLPSPAPTPARSGRRLPIAMLALGLAAGLLISTLIPAPRTEQRVAAGRALVEGRVDLLAGDVPVQVDGKIEVRVEPPPGLTREKLSEIQRMDKTHFLAALAGAGVTLAVVEGTALVQPADAAPFTLSAGETRAVSPTPTAPEAGAKPGRATPDQVARELAALKLEHALTLGQLRALGGSASPWPEKLPEGYRPANFEAFVRARVAALPATSVVAIDCDEYPCIAVVRSHDPSDRWSESLTELHDDLDGAAYGEGTNVVGFASVDDRGQGPVKLYAFSVLPGDEGGPSPEVRSRLEVRVRGNLEGASEELASAPERELEVMGYIEP